MFRKYGLTPSSTNLSNKLLLYKVLSESWLRTVAGNCLGSPTKINLMDPVCNGMTTLDYVAWAASSTMIREILSRSDYIRSDPLLFNVVKRISHD